MGDAQLVMYRQFVYTKLVKFEWNDAKNRRNVRKHSIGFEIAERFFSNPHLERIDDRQDYGEERLIALGEVEGIVLVVVYIAVTATVYRIISIRRALKYEQKMYYQWRYKNHS
jgi:uncharacterized protein